MKPAWSLRTRLILTYWLIILFGLGALVVRLGFQIRQGIIEEAEHELEIEGFLIANTLSPLLVDLPNSISSDDELTTWLRRYTTQSGERLTLIDRQRKVITSTETDLVPPHLEHEHPEILSALSGNEQHDIRWDEWSQSMRLFTAVPLRHETEIVGALQLSIPFAQVEEKIVAAWMMIISTALMAAALSLPVSFWLSETILRPVRRLQVAAYRIAGGELNTRLEVRGNDELAYLGRAFNEMANQLEKLFQEQKRFVADASHELRTPIAGIKLHAEALLQGGIEDKEVAMRFLQEIDKESERLARLSNQLLNLARIDEANQTLQARLLDFNALSREVVSRFRLQAERAACLLELHQPAEPLPLCGDAEMLDRALSNLIDNALKYTLPGGKVMVRVSQTQDDGIPNPPPLVKVEVIDTGRGIPTEDLPHVFKRFYRVDKSRTRSKGGSGLGLSIAKAVIDAHGGEIGVESSVGRGSCFWFTLPLSEQPCQAPQDPPFTPSVSTFPPA